MYKNVASFSKALKAGLVLKDCDGDYWEWNKDGFRCYTKYHRISYEWVDIDLKDMNEIQFDKFKPFIEITELEKELYI